MLRIFVFCVLFVLAHLGASTPSPAADLTTDPICVRQSIELHSVHEKDTRTFVFGFSCYLNYEGGTNLDSRPVSQVVARLLSHQMFGGRRPVVADILRFPLGDTDVRAMVFLNHVPGKPFNNTTEETAFGCTTSARGNDFSSREIVVNFDCSMGTMVYFGKALDEYLTRYAGSMSYARLVPVQGEGPSADPREYDFLVVLKYPQ